MCAIAGSKNNKEVSKMLETMKHRAPDGLNQITKNGYTIGMGRLAIIDLLSPNLFPLEDDPYILTFNGEIYNYKELRIILTNLGHTFRTQSDIEVLMKAYRQWGAGCLDRLNGMFAFAIYDGQQIFLARDIAGEKPLYFTRKPFRFASEAKALNFKCEELPHAHCMTVCLKTGLIGIRKYWEPELRTINLRTAEEELEELLEDSVKLRTQSDVPYGLYYSKGVDSSLINTFHNFEHTFTYKEHKHSNRRRGFFRNFKKILYHLDGPVNSFSAYGLFRLANEASRKVKVVLSGEGADELFGGYIRYVLPHFNWTAKKKFPSYTTMFEPAKDVGASGWEEFNGNMQELLRMGDRMAAMFGLENRCPFLDKRIIQFAYSLPFNLKIDGLETKVILNNILKRRKHGYQIPEKKGLYCSVNKWLGVSDHYRKKEYRAFQEQLWKKIKSQ